MATLEHDPRAGLAGLRILVVEDVGVIAMQLRRQLTELNCTITGVAARLDAAVELARTEELDGVLLDLNLAGRISYPVAAILEARDIPYILISGYDTSHLRPEYADAPHLQKPYSGEALAAMMAETFVKP